MKNNKIILLISLLICNQVFTADFSQKIEEDLVVDFYNAQDDEAAVRNIVLEFYEIEDGLKNQYSSENFENVKKSMIEIYDNNPSMHLNERALVLLYQGKAIGACGFDIDNETADAYIYMFAIDKNFRRHGYGEKFLNKAIEGIHLIGKAKSVSLTSHPVTNSAAIKLYKKVGFQEVGEQGNLLKFSKKIVD